MEYRSCRFIEHGIYFKYNAEGSISVKHCCNMDAEKESAQAIIQKVRNLDDIDWDNVFEQKRIMRENAKKGIYHPVCQKCWEILPLECDSEDYLSEITFAHIMRCNSRCIYCSIGTDKHLYNSKQIFTMLPLIKELMSKNLIRFNGSLRYMGGEPTLMSDFEEITDLFVDNGIREIYLPSSGIKYSKAMERACQKIEKCEIFISIDSGCPETYKKIKEINAYKLVLNSLKNYSKNRKIKGKDIISKYIVLPYYNDNTTEIDKWINESKKAGLTMLAPDAEQTYISDCKKQRYLKHVYNVLQYAINKIKKSDFTCVEVVYLKMLNKWVSENHETFFHDFSDKIYNIDISDMTTENIKEEIDIIFEKYSIWNKPILNLKSKKEITEYKDFEKILYECILNGFKITLTTNGKHKSPMIEEALKIADITVNIPENGRYCRHYSKISPEKISKTENKGFFKFFDFFKK